ncbi:MAG: beta strand repeat-containing protein [Opitutaceae bacterium]
MHRLLSVRFAAPLLLVLAFVPTALRAQTILPDATAGQAYSFQITTNPPQPAGTAYSADGLPSGLAVDASSGLIAGTTTAVGTYKGNLELDAGGSSSTYPFQITVDPAAGTPVITSPGAAVGTVGTAFSYTLTATDNPGSFNIAQLPPGLTASGATISGTPTAAGLFFTSVSGDNGNGQGAVLVLMFTMDPAGPVPEVTSALAASGMPNAAYTYTITATNQPTSFAATNLPAGLTLDAGTGVISGTPTAPAVTTVGLSAANGYGSGPLSNLTLTIGAFSSITSAADLSGTVGAPLSYTLTADNSPYNYAVDGLPAGLTLNSITGVVSGTPATAGTYTLTATALNSLGDGPPTALTLTVTDPGGVGGDPVPPAIVTQPADQTGTIGSTVQFSVTAAGSGAFTYQWSLGGKPISGQTGPSLMIANLQATDAGAYSVTVSNGVGSVTSEPATLTLSSLTVPPAITYEPANATATVGSPVSFSVGATGSTPLSYQWSFGGVPIAGATGPVLTLSSPILSDAGSYTATVTNAAGSAASEAAVLTVSPTAVAPIFEWQPSSVAVNPGGTAVFSVGIAGTAPFAYQWYEGDAAIAGQTGSTLVLDNAQASDAGTYHVTIANAAGTVTSADATLSVPAPDGVPVPISFELQPVPIAATVGASASFSVAATGDGAISYQWRKNEAPIPGATGPTFTITNVQASDSGVYDVLVANAFSATYSTPAPLTVVPVTTPSRLVNVSVRDYVGLGDQALVVGFVIQGSGPKQTLIRGIGPTLANYGVTSPMAHPVLTVYGPEVNLVASNDTWGGSSALAAAFAQVGAFALPANSLDSAVLTSLPPAAYTAEVTGADGTTGVALLEAYDADPSIPAPTSRFTNISARGMIGAGQNAPAIGFTLAGTTNQTVLIRAVGPTLAEFGVSGTVPDPSLTLYDSNHNALATNTGWGGSAEFVAAFNAVGAFHLPTDSKDSALLVTLAPGTYTVQATSASGGSGVALVELYQLP